MKLGTEGLALIRYFEGCKLTSYKCHGGKWTIGYGDTGPTVVPGMKITLEEAETRLHDSTLLRKLNAVDAEGAAAQFRVWKYAAGRVSAGLITRRAAERVLFEGGDWQAEAERLRAEARRKPRA